MNGGACFTNGIHYFRREHSQSISSSKKNSLFYNISLIRFKKDLIPYVSNSVCTSEVKRKLLKYSYFDHLRLFIKQAIYQEIDMQLYVDYISNIKNHNRYRYYQALSFSPIIFLLVTALFLRKKLFSILSGPLKIIE